MHQSSDQAAELIEEVAGRAHAALPGVDDETISAFLRRYWSRVPGDELLRREPADLEGAAVAHLRSGLRRDPGTSVVRVYTPAASDDGWRSPHSVVDCVTDDMPFIVDSLGMQIAQRGTAVHLL